MALNSKIEWTDHTVNLWHGCTKVHAGCDHCYAEKQSKRWGNDVWGHNKPRKLINSAFNELQKIEKIGKTTGKLQTVFMGSMMDIFEKPIQVISSSGTTVLDDNLEVVTTGVIRDKLFNDISGGKYPNIIFLFLTKRPSNIDDFIPKSWFETMPENVMLGTSISDQKTANDLVKKIDIHTPRSAKLFLSIEPQIGEISYLENINYSKGKFKWIIQGGESGPCKRPFELAWTKPIRSICRELGIKYFFKQIDKVKPIPEEYFCQQFPDFFGKEDIPYNKGHFNS